MAGSHDFHRSTLLPDPVLSARLEALCALAERTSDRIMVVDRHQTIIYANQAAWKERSLTQSSIRPAKCYEAFLEQTDPCERCPAEEVFESGEVRTVSCTLGGEGPTCGMHQAFPLIARDGTTDSVLVLFSNPNSESAHIGVPISPLSLFQTKGTADSRRLGELIGISAPMQQLFNLIRLVSDSQAAALLLGESGTGKELVARTIHQLSDRRHQPFVVVDCGALPESLLESELFGHVKGAFTGAHSSKRGLLEEADGGTVFLDEIGDASLSCQSKLLRVLQEGEIKPVGSICSLKIDVRFISATNKDLAQQMRRKAFREDLYYRISVLPMLLPPLRERSEDMPLLVEQFIVDSSTLNHKPNRSVSRAAMAALAEAPWPGNVRELQHLIERVVVTSLSATFEKEDFFPTASGEPPVSDLRTLSRHATQRVERETITQALQDAAGNRAKAARFLGISRASLYNKLRLHRIV